MAGRFWWVNHSGTSHWETAGGYLWFASGSPASQARSESHKNILRVMPGDVIFSFAAGAVGAVGVVLEPAQEAARPAEFGSRSGHSESESGWSIPVRFASLSRPLRTVDHATELRPALPKANSPIRVNGLCNERVLLAAVPDPLAARLRILLNGELERIVDSVLETAGRSLAADAAAAAIRRRTDMGPELKALLLKARHGHGFYRVNLERVEGACRITGLLDRRHLRAVHIKPWSECDDHEKLDGLNGLLMSPHVAHLFERGHISFADDGELLVSTALNPAVLESWGVQLPRNVGSFSPEQCVFLDYHRRRVFERHDGGRRQAAQGNDAAAVPDAGPAELNGELSGGPRVLNPA